MEFNVPPVGGVDGARGPTRVPRSPSAAAKPRDFSKELSEGSDVQIDVAASPPPELGPEIGRASARYDELRSEQRELHFATHPRSGRLVIEVRDLDSNVLRTIPPTK